MSKQDEYKQTYSQAVSRTLQNWAVTRAAASVSNDLLPTWRQGLDELSHALQAFPESIPITPEAGAIGEPTPQQVYQEQGGYLELQQQRIQVPEQQQEKQQER